MMDLLGVKRELKEAAETATATIRRGDALLDTLEGAATDIAASAANARVITDDIRAITSMMRAALVKDHT